MGIITQDDTITRNIEKLLDLLDDSKIDVVMAAIRALGHLAKEARTLEIVDRLFLLLQRHEYQIELEIFRVLRLLGETNARIYIEEKLSGLLVNNKLNLEMLIQVLEDLSPDTPMARDNLCLLLNSDNTRLRRAALKALKAIHTNLIDKQTISIILPLLQDRRVSETAYEALESMNVKLGRWVTTPGLQ